MQKIEWLFLFYFFFPRDEEEVNFVSQGLSVQITIT